MSGESIRRLCLVICPVVISLDAGIIDPNYMTLNIDIVSIVLVCDDDQKGGERRGGWVLGA